MQSRLAEDKQRRLWIETRLQQCECQNYSFPIGREDAVKNKRMCFFIIIVYLFFFLNYLLVSLTKAGQCHQIFKFKKKIFCAQLILLCFPLNMIQLFTVVCSFHVTSHPRELGCFHFDSIICQLACVAMCHEICLGQVEATEQAPVCCK